LLNIHPQVIIVSPKSANIDFTAWTATFGRPFRDTIPLVEAGNGDWIAQNYRTSVVYYLSHDGDAEMNGNRLEGAS
ncbi:MAG: hypothetical protein AAFV88_26400, partial [Planctomycetota bacterium]